MNINHIDEVSERLSLALKSKGIYTFNGEQIWLVSAIIAAILDGTLMEDTNYPTEEQTARAREMYGDD